MEDQIIIKELLNGDTAERAFRELTKSYGQRVYWHVRKMVVDHDDANDVTQEIFIKIWKNKDKFRGDSGLFTWIYRIATNETLNFLEKKKRALVTGDYEEILSNQMSSDSLISGDEIQLKLQKAILKLPEKQRIVFNLKYFEDLKFKEIAEVTDTSIGALKASYHLAVKKIEEFITAD